MLNSRTNPKYHHHHPHHHQQMQQHQYSESLLSGMQHDSSECGSATYAMPAYIGSGSDGNHATYSTTTADYHPPNCNCHLELQVPPPPPHCASPAMTSMQSAECSASSGSGATSSNYTKDIWITDKSSCRNQAVNRLKQPIAFLWACLSIVLFVLCTVALTQASWLVGNTTRQSLGLLKQCKLQRGTPDSIQCEYYNGLAALHLPSISWKLSLIFYCIADTLLGLSTMLALCTILFRTAKARRHLSFFTGYVQLFAGESNIKNV